MELQLIISGDHKEILAVLKKISQKGQPIAGTLDEVHSIGPGEQLPSEKSETKLPPVVGQAPETVPGIRRCACGCGNIVTGKRGWNYHYYSLKCYMTSLDGHIPAPREFSIPEGQDMGPVSNQDSNLKKKLEKIKKTCPAPGKGPDIQREFT